VNGGNLLIPTEHLRLVYTRQAFFLKVALI
jgi:hypothetical protein